ncbi:unnamed protein product [Lactuca virosa]|uniref:PGG domain-containing protein n=1 Tax=Lactuca virosa TaxID=75947 RepID=A0AAU9NNC2_9ASTR|nr:unnamed protein product [Lactuca virosa]
MLNLKIVCFGRNEPIKWKRRFNSADSHQPATFRETPEWKRILSELLEASKEGNWKAAYAGHTLFVENLVRLMKDADLELKNSSSNTALHIVAQGKNVVIAKVLATKNTELLDMEGNDGKLPLQMAALSGNHDMVMYLHGMSKRMKCSPWTDERRCGVLLTCVEAELFEVAQEIVKDFPKLAQSEDEDGILGILARQRNAFNIKKHLYQYDAYHGHVDEGNQAVQLFRIILTYLRKPNGCHGDEENQAVELLRMILANIPKTITDDMRRGPVDQIMEDKMLEEACQCPTYISRVLFVAAEEDNTAFLAVLIGEYPKLVLDLNDKKKTLFQVAILCRCPGIFNLLCGVGSIKDSIITAEDENGNNLLHLVGILEEATMSNQCQDFQEPDVEMAEKEKWFKMVSDMLPPSLREKKNKDGLRPRELFTKNHKELFLKAVDSDKKTVYVLYASVMSLLVVIAASTVYPNHRDIGLLSALAMLLHGMAFILTFTSVVSTLSIMWPNYVERGFFSLRSVIASIMRRNLMAVVLVFFTAAMTYNPYVLLLATIMMIIPFLYWIICRNSITSLRNL